jgi:hypothetical protein
MRNAQLVVVKERERERETGIGSTWDADVRLHFGSISDAGEGFAFWVDFGCSREIGFWVHFRCSRGICIWVYSQPEHKPQSITDARLAYWIVRSE